MSTDVIFGSIGVVLFIAIVFEVYKYIKGHPQALADVEKEIANLKGQASTAADTAAIHAKLDALITKVDATHAAALAPVSVTVVPATPQGQSVTDKLFPQRQPVNQADAADQPAPDHTGFDFGQVPSGDYKRNTLNGGQGYTFTFTVATAQKLRLVVASDATMGKPAFDNFALTITKDGVTVQSLNQQSNTGASYIETPILQPGAYSMAFSVDKTDLVILQFVPG